MKCVALAIKLRNWTSLHKSIAYLQTATFLKKNQKLSMDLMEMIGIFLISLTSPAVARLCSFIEIWYSDICMQINCF